MDKKVEKQLRKELETPQEKAARRLLKRQQKAGRKAEQEAFLGYSNDANPFHDTNLSESFVWRKKLEKLQSEGRLDPNWKKGIKRKREELRAEIDEVKQRRAQREREKALAEAQRAKLQRQEEARNALEFDKRGEVFDALQLRQRRDARLRDCRPELVDVLSRNLDLLLCPADPSLATHKLDPREPFQLLSDSATTADELRTLRKDVRMLVTYFSSLHANAAAGLPVVDDVFHSEDPATATALATQYWASLLVVVEDELQQRTQPEGGGGGSSGDQQQQLQQRGKELISGSLLRQHHGIHGSVLQDVILALQDKTPEELEKMEQEMSERVRSGGSGVDVDYWLTLLKHLKLLKAKAALRQLHTAMMAAFVARLARLRDAGAEKKAREEQRRAQFKEKMRQEEWEGAQQEGERASEGEDEDFSPRLERYSDDTDAENPNPNTTTTTTSSSYPLKGDKDVGALVTTTTTTSAAGAGTPAEGVDGDEKEQQQKRLELVAMEKIKHLENEKMQMDAARKMGLDDKLMQDETLFCDEYDLGVRKLYDMGDRFRPRKPKYFNRVHTGYEWNKYNRTHYDYDNPPPKVVMGYKFNIFYPDLADPTRQQPVYFVEPTEKGWSDDVCVIRFHAGPPYEDIAFKIVNRHWDYNPRKGFKCTFERGVLHLYFNFVRYFYRR